MRSPCCATMMAKLLHAPSLPGSSSNTLACRRFASSVAPLRWAWMACVRSCSLGTSTPRPLRFAIVHVLDLEAGRAAIQLHINDWPREPNFAQRPWSLEQGALIFVAGRVNEGSALGRRDGHKHRDGYRRMGDIPHDIDLDRRRLRRRFRLDLCHLHMV